MSASESRPNVWSRTRTALLLAITPGLLGLALAHWPVTSSLEKTFGVDLLFKLRYGSDVVNLTVTTGTLVAGAIDITGDLNADQNVETDTGAIDVDGDIDTEGTLISQTGISVGYGTCSNFAYLGFNLEDPFTGDPRIRQAIAHAIDRRAIIAHVLGDAANLAAALLPPDHWAGNPDLQPVAYDPQRARALLREAGYTDEAPLELRYKTSTDPLRIRIATVIQDQLKQVGIDMALQSYDWGTFYGDIKAGRFQLYSLAWVGIKTPDIFRYAFHSTSLPPAGANRGRLSDKQVDRLIEAAEQAPSIEAQAAAFRRVQARLLDILPYVPLWYEDHVYVIRNDLLGYRLARDGVDMSAAAYDQKFKVGDFSSYLLNSIQQQ